ncbi:MAG: hypothetical protein ABFS46_18125 [Myxococcota bacterium]
MPAQIRAEWIGYQLAIGDMLTRMSSYLARLAKAEKDHAKRIAAAVQEMRGEAPDENGAAPHAPAGAPGSKAELRRLLRQRQSGVQQR